VRQPRQPLGGGPGRAIPSPCAAFHVPFAHFLTCTFLRGLRVLQWLAHGSNGSHAALITPMMRVQKLDQFSAPRAVSVSTDVGPIETLAEAGAIVGET
jgi:hypothetical protein